MAPPNFTPPQPSAACRNEPIAAVQTAACCVARTGEAARSRAVGVVLRALLDEQLRNENYDPAPQDDGQHGPGIHESDSDPIHLQLNAEVQPKLDVRGDWARTCQPANRQPWVLRGNRGVGQGGRLRSSGKTAARSASRLWRVPRCVATTA